MATRKESINDVNMNEILQPRMEARSGNPLEIASMWIERGERWIAFVYLFIVAAAAIHLTTTVANHRWS